MSHVYDPPIDQPTQPARPRESASLTCRVDGSTLFLIGEADAGAVEVITACLDQAPSVGNIKLDLSDVTFLDLTALRVILEFGKELAAADRSLSVVNPSRPVTLLLRVAGFDGILLCSGATAIWSPTLSISGSSVTGSTFAGVTRRIRVAGPRLETTAARSRRRPEPVPMARPRCRRVVIAMIEMPPRGCRRRACG